MGSYLIRGAYLLTLDDGNGELVIGDVRIEDQHIFRYRPGAWERGR